MQIRQDYNQYIKAFANQCVLQSYNVKLNVTTHNELLNSFRYLLHVYERTVVFYLMHNTDKDVENTINKVVLAIADFNSTIKDIKNNFGIDSNFLEYEMLFLIETIETANLFLEDSCVQKNLICMLNNIHYNLLANYSKLYKFNN